MPETPPTSPQPAAPDNAKRLTAHQRVTSAWTWLVGLLAIAALLISWQSNRRIGLLESALVKRQETSQNQVQEALLLARQSQDLARDASAKVALLNAKFDEQRLQRSQIDGLIQSLSQSRDAQLINELDTSLRVATQQSALTGSAEPLITVLESAQDRLSKIPQARLDSLKRGVAKDIDELKNTQIADIPSLIIRLDEAIRMIDTLPMLADAARSKAENKKSKHPSTADKQARSTPSSNDWHTGFSAWWQRQAEASLSEIKRLVRVTQLEHPEAGLLSPNQAYFVRENLKLRLLNARLSLISRQSDAALADINRAQSQLTHFFDMKQSQAETVQVLLDEMTEQLKLLRIPRPDASLAAISALTLTP
jgi:uroporphyrin-III C-methyltransferase